MAKPKVSGILKEAAYAVFSYLPIILLWHYVPSDGSAADVQYVEAFRLFFFVAVVHLALAMYWLVPFDRIAIATDLWLVLCGALAWAEFWEPLRWFAGHLRGTGVWVIAVPLCLYLVYRSKYGVIGARIGDREAIRKHSLVLVAAMCAVLVASYFVRDSVVWSVIIPTIILSFSMGRIRKSLENSAVAT